MMNADERAIIRAASQAGKAADWLHAQQPGAGSQADPKSEETVPDPTLAPVGEAA